MTSGSPKLAQNERPDVAAIAESEARYQATEAALRKSEEMLRRTQAIAHVAGWSYDIAEGKFAFTDNALRVMRWQTSDGDQLDFGKAIHPDDMPRVTECW